MRARSAPIPTSPQRGEVKSECFKLIGIGSNRHAALVYVARRLGRGRPRPGYMEIVIAGAREAGLPAWYIRDLARLANRPDLCQQTRRGPPRPLRPPRPGGGGGAGVSVDGEGNA
jgi:hypothetical protein